MMLFLKTLLLLLLQSCWHEPTHASDGDSTNRVSLSSDSSSSENDGPPGECNYKLGVGVEYFEEGEKEKDESVLCIQRSIASSLDDFVVEYLVEELKEDPSIEWGAVNNVTYIGNDKIISLLIDDGVERAFVCRDGVCNDVFIPPPLGPLLRIPETPEPTISPTQKPTQEPSSEPSASPSSNPSASPSFSPSSEPSGTPSSSPTGSPSSSPSTEPSATPSASPSSEPTAAPSLSPSSSPSAAPSMSPSFAPSSFPSSAPSATPSFSPTPRPTRPPRGSSSGRRERRVRKAVSKNEANVDMSLSTHPHDGKATVLEDWSNKRRTLTDPIAVIDGREMNSNEGQHRDLLNDAATAVPKKKKKKKKKRKKVTAAATTSTKKKNKKNFATALEVQAQNCPFCNPDNLDGFRRRAAAHQFLRDLQQGRFEQFVSDRIAVKIKQDCTKVKEVFKSHLREIV